MADPTPDEAAARLRKLADSTLRGALWQGTTTRDDLLAVLAERDALRAELDVARRDLAAAATRETAVRELADDLPDLLQTYAWSHQDGTWLGYAEFVAGRIRAALAGSAEADGPALREDCGKEEHDGWMQPEPG